MNSKILMQLEEEGTFEKMIKALYKKNWSFYLFFFDNRSPTRARFKVIAFYYNNLIISCRTENHVQVHQSWRYLEMIGRILTQSRFWIVSKEPGRIIQKSNCPSNCLNSCLFSSKPQCRLMWSQWERHHKDSLFLVMCTPILNPPWFWRTLTTTIECGWRRQRF